MTVTAWDLVLVLALAPALVSGQCFRTLVGGKYEVPVDAAAANGSAHSTLQDAMDACLASDDGIPYVFSVAGAGAPLSGPGWGGISVTRADWTVQTAPGDPAPVQFNVTQDTFIRMVASGDVTLDRVNFLSVEEDIKTVASPAFYGDPSILDISNAIHVVLRDVHVFGASRTPFVFTDCRNVTIEDSSIRSVSLGGAFGYGSLDSLQTSGCIALNNCQGVSVRNLTAVDFAAQFDPSNVQTYGSVIHAAMPAGGVAEFDGLNFVNCKGQKGVALSVVSAEDNVSPFHVHIRDSVFSGSSYLNGGELQGVVNLISAAAESTATITSSVFQDSRMEHHSGIIAYSVNVGVFSCSFDGNEVAASGGMGHDAMDIYVEEGDLMLESSVFSNAKGAKENLALVSVVRADKFHVRDCSVPGAPDYSSNESPAFRTFRVSEVLMDGVSMSNWGVGPAIMVYPDSAGLSFTSAQSITLSNITLTNNTRLSAPAISLLTVIPSQSNPVSQEASTLSISGLTLRNLHRIYVAAHGFLEAAHGMVYVRLPFKVAYDHPWSETWSVDVHGVTMDSLACQDSVGSGAVNRKGVGIVVEGGGIASFVLEDVVATSLVADGGGSLLVLDTAPLALLLDRIHVDGVSQVLGHGLIALYNRPPFDTVTRRSVTPYPPALPDASYRHNIFNVTVKNVFLEAGHGVIRYGVPTELYNLASARINLNLEGIVMKEVTCGNSPMDPGCGIAVVQGSASSSKAYINVYLSRSLFTLVQASGSGGVFYWQASGDLRQQLYVSDCEFSFCSADAKAGVFYLYGVEAAISDSTFSGNNACKYCTPTAEQNSLGGAVYTLGRGSRLNTLTIANSTFVECDAGRGGAVASHSPHQVIITDSVFETCHARHGGALAVMTGSQAASELADAGDVVSISNTVFDRNSAEKQGGGVFVYRYPVNMTNVVVSGGTAAEEGGGFVLFEADALESVIADSWFEGNVADIGGGIVSRDSSLLVTDTSMLGNNATDRGGAFACISDLAGVESHYLVADDSVVNLGNFAHGESGNNTHFILCEQCSACFQCPGCLTDQEATCCTTVVGGCCCTSDDLEPSGIGAEMSCIPMTVQLPIAAVIGVALSIVVVTSMIAALLYRTYLRSREADVGDEILDPKFDPAKARGAVSAGGDNASLENQRAQYL